MGFLKNIIADSHLPGCTPGVGESIAAASRSWSLGNPPDAPTDAVPVDAPPGPEVNIPEVNIRELDRSPRPVQRAMNRPARAGSTQSKAVASEVRTLQSGSNILAPNTALTERPNPTSNLSGQAGGATLRATPATDVIKAASSHAHASTGIGVGANNGPGIVPARQVTGRSSQEELPQSLGSDTNANLENTTATGQPASIANASAAVRSAPAKPGSATELPSDTVTTPAGDAHTATVTTPGPSRVHQAEVKPGSVTVPTQPDRRVESWLARERQTRSRSVVQTPQVRIGQVNVIVEAPATPPRQSQTAAADDASGWLFLRSL